MWYFEPHNHKIYSSVSFFLVQCFWSKILILHWDSKTVKRFLCTSMFYLHASNRTENLLQHLAAVIKADAKGDIFATEMFLIQSQGMERMICQTMADEFGSFCNFNFMFPIHFLNFIADQIGIQAASEGYDRPNLTWRIETLLRDLSDDSLADLRSYLTGSNSELKRFQLACKLANIFDQYQVMRPEMIDSWAQNRHHTDHPAEKWQMALWSKLNAGPDGGDHRGFLIRQVIARLKSGGTYSHLLPDRISVLGLNIMPPVFLEFLNGLAPHCDVHLFILSPCRHYWGDVESRRIQLKRILHLSLEQDEKHPLLAGMGQQGRDFQKMMLENVDFEVEFESFKDPLEETGGATLLRALQSDLLHGEISAEKSYPASVCDSSVRVVSCHSALRETAVLRDHLLRLLHEDPTLQLRDIIVMAPDIQEYAPLIPAVFGDLQYSIADYSLERKNIYVNVFLSFLELFKGRFGWSEIVDLLRQPIVSSNYALTLTDLDTLQQWVIDSGIRWGLSTEHREQMGFDFSEASWSAGLERFLMGYAVDSEEFVDGVLPFPDIEGSGAQIVGVLCQFVEFIEQSRISFMSGYNLECWSDILLTAMQNLFGESDHKDYMELQRLLSDPAVRYAKFHGDNVSFDVIFEWLKLSVRESRSSSGFLRGQLTFCSMLPMRSVPFRVVCLIGLNDGVFPRNDNKANFDLMSREFRTGDRSIRDDDRYQFLEALLAARTHLYLSYIGQSIRTNDSIPPSVVLTEFLDVLSRNYGVDDVVVAHPLHPFNKKYFVKGEENRLFSYNRYYCRTAEHLQKEHLPEEPWWQGELEGDYEQINFSELVRFYRNPQNWFAENILGVYFAKKQELPPERELFNLGGLERYKVDQEIVEKSMDGLKPSVLEKLKVEGRWPLGPPGSMQYSEKLDELAPFMDLVRNQEMGTAIADRSFEFQVGRYTLAGTLSNLYEHGVMLARYAEVKGKDLLACWLHHLVANHILGETKSIIVTSSDVFTFSSTDSNPGLELLLDYFVAGSHMPSQFYVEPALSYCRQMTASRSKLSPLDKSIDAMDHILEKGYEPAWSLLLQGHDPASVLGDEFERLCLEIMHPIWSAAHGS